MILIAEAQQVTAHRVAAIAGLFIAMIQIGATAGTDRAILRVIKRYKRNTLQAQLEGKSNAHQSGKD